MDKETLSNYGWIVVCVLVLACMLALATPFGNFIAEGFKATYVSFWQGGNAAIGGVGNVIEAPPTSAEQLQSMYKFDYYSSVALAADDVSAGTIGENADCDKKDAVAGIYTDKNGKVNIIVLKDNNEKRTAVIEKNVTINLDGHKLSYINQENNVAFSIPVKNVKCVIDGKRKGSEIIVNADTDGKDAKMFVSQYSDFAIYRGKYSVYSETSYACVVQIGGNCEISDVVMNASNKVKTVSVVYSVGEGKTLSIKNSELNVNVDYKETDTTTCAVQSASNATIKNCKITVQSDGVSDTIAVSNMENGIMTIDNSQIITEASNAESYGVCATKTTSTTTMNNCVVVSNIAALYSRGTLTINGGTYSSPGYGAGIIGGTAHIRDARLTYKISPEEALSLPATSESTRRQGLCIAGTSNSKVYVDNCLIETDNDGYNGGIMLSHPVSTSDRNNTLYMSNCTVTSETINKKFIRVDHSTFSVYIGKNNTFNGDATWDKDKIIWFNNTWDPNAGNATIIKNEEVYR